jgi:hypothetical protein
MWTTQARCPHTHRPNNRHKRVQRAILKQKIARPPYQGSATRMRGNLIKPPTDTAEEAKNGDLLGIVGSRVDALGGQLPRLPAMAVPVRVAILWQIVRDRVMRLLAMIARRCLWMPPTLLGLVLLVFAISHVIPSEPARVMAGENAPPEHVAALREKYGLDRPLPVQFVRYVADVVRGNMGISLFTQRPVAEDLLARLPATLELALYAIGIAVVAGVPLGVIAALRRNSLLDHVVRVVTVAGLAMAAFWLAIL